MEVEKDELTKYAELYATLCNNFIGTLNNLKNSETSSEKKIEILSEIFIDFLENNIRQEQLIAILNNKIELVNNKVDSVIKDVYPSNENT